MKAFGPRARGFRFNGRGRLRDGYYIARFRVRAPDGSTDTRRVALRRVRGRFRTAPDFEVRRPCGLVDAFKLERPVFGGTRNGALDAAFRLGDAAQVTVEVRRGRRVVRRFPKRTYVAGRTHRLRITAPRAGRGVYTVTLKAERPGRSSTLSLRATRL